MQKTVESELVFLVIKECKCEHHILFYNEPDRQGIY
jgi:hypothetical protein